jgi:hypothetical protein
LRHEGELARITRLEGVGVCSRLDQGDGLIGKLAHGADDLGVPRMADEQDLQAFLVVPGGLDMHLENERARGIEHEHVARLGGGRDRLGDAVC